jgi:hypothetical protein
MARPRSTINCHPPSLKSVAKQPKLIGSQYLIHRGLSNAVSLTTKLKTYSDTKAGASITPNSATVSKTEDTRLYINLVLVDLGLCGWSEIRNYTDLWL